MKETRRLAMLAMLWLISLLAVAQGPPLAMKLDSVFTPKNLMPKGKYYQATVPDTLDLAERGRLAVRGLTNFLNPDKMYEHYSHAYFNVNPPYMTCTGDGGANWGKIAESLLEMRLISGSKENLDIEAAMLKGMVSHIKRNGNFYVWLSGVPLEHGYGLIPVCSARVMISLMMLYQQTRDEKLRSLIVLMADGIAADAKYKEGNKAYFSDMPPEVDDASIGVLGYWKPIFMNGSTLRGMSRTYPLTGDRKYLELSDKLHNFILDPRYWKPEAAPKVVVGAEHGQFMGHHHSYTSALMGLLWYATIANDGRTKEFVRQSYEYLRTFGIARIGLFGEMCTTGDMTWLAVKLADLGVGDYWDDADCYARNQLLEQQMTFPDRLRQAVETMPKKDKLDYPFDETNDKVIERNIGAWMSDASNPTKVRPQTLRWTICCSGNCPPGVYAVWEAAVRCANGAAQINFLLNRASPWLDIDSYLPYEGKVVIKNKTAQTISVRMPRWVDRKAIAGDVNGAKASPYWAGNCLVFEGLKKKDVVTIQFPMVQTTEKYTLMWREESMWPESTNPGNNWKPQDKPDVFTLTMRGNTLVDIAPRSKMAGYDLYLRDEMKRTKSPMIEVERFVPDAEVKW